MSDEKPGGGIATPARIASVQPGPNGSVVLIYATPDGMAGLVLAEDDAINTGVRLLQAAAADDDDPLAFPVEGVVGSISEEDKLVLNFTLSGRYLPLALAAPTVAALKAVLAEYEASDPPPAGQRH